jgi:hypothetical protein
VSDAAPQPGFEALLPNGERGRALGYAGGMLRLACERAHPPGEPLTLTLRLAEGELALQGKSAGSKRRPDGGFDVALRLTSLRREQRAQLEALWAPN